jgi:broad specificity phosphatase PhoE
LPVVGSAITSKVGSAPHPGGETPAAIGTRVDRVIARIRSVNGNVLVFSSSHILRVLTARWLGLDASGGRYFILNTATISTLGYEHNRNEPVIRWNQTCSNMASWVA